MASPKASTLKPARAGLILSATTRRASSSGFTLIEIMVVMGLFVIIAGLGLVMSMESYRGNAIRNDRDGIVAALQTARSQAINNVCSGPVPPTCSCTDPNCCCDGRAHGVRVNPSTDPGSIIIFQCQPGATIANAFSGSPSGSRNTAFDYKIKLDYSPAMFNWANNDIIFDKLSGNATAKNPPKKIIITDNAHQSLTITVNDQGQIDWTAVTH